MFYLPVAYNVKAPRVRLQAELYDFAPQLARVEYSCNFAPFVSVPVDKWGAVALPDFSVAEGQNIITFRLTNQLGQTAQQYLRIIRSSTPLLASEIYPAPQTAVGTGNLTISLVFYNAQFISNNIEVSSIEAVLLDGRELAADRYVLTRGSNHTYQNFLRLDIPVVLAEGRHTVTVKARDTYAHQNETNWFFDVDLTAPEIVIPQTAPVRQGQTIELNYELNDAQSAALQDLRLNLRQAERIFWSQSYPLAGLGPQQELLVSVNELLDGEYSLEIGAADLAGNRTVRTGSVFIDSAPPRIECNFQGYLNQTNPLTEFTVTADEEISGQIILGDRLKDIRIPLPLEQSSSQSYTALLNGRNIPDGVYTVSVLAQDAAGNQAAIDCGALLADSTGPQLSGLHAEPAVLHRNNAYQLRISLTILDDSPEDAGYPRAVRAQVVFLHKSTGREVHNAPLTAQDGHFRADWSAADTRYLPGAYLARVTAWDAFGNKTVRECEFIKDGIAPELTAPAEYAPVSGLALITGKVSDIDWTNAQDFASYTVYWAEGFQDLPPDLRALDPRLWQDAGLETPYVNRGGAARKNISYRAAPENTLLCWWDTAALPAGAYTILLVSAEKDLGPTAGTVRRVFIEPAAASAVNVRLHGDFADIVDYAVSAGVTFNILNNGGTANISAEIIDKYGQVVKYNFWPEVPGIIYAGQPAEFSDGAYLWQADGWHLRLATAEACSFNVLLSGVERVSAAELPYSLNSGLLQLSGELAAGAQPEIVFDFQPGAGNLYINAERGRPADAESTPLWLRIGAGGYVPWTNSYALAVAGQSGALSLSWDGRLPAGGYADSGEYTLQLLGSGVDGGVCRAAVTFNIVTPFSAQNKGLAPEDGSFDPFGGLNKITLAYTADKAGYLSAVILDAAGTTVSVLPEQQIPGSVQTGYLSWNGAYPRFDSGQRLVSGDYRALLTFRTADGQQETLRYDRIQIRNNSSGDLARLLPLGEAILFNGQPVQAAAGSAEYYWSARGEGTYTVPRTFSYELGVSGQQTVTAAPFVPFAGLYHRGFDRVDLIVEIAYRWSIDYKTGSGAGWKTMGEGQETDSFAVSFTSRNQMVSGLNSAEHPSGFQMAALSYDYVNPGAGSITVTLKDRAGNVLYSGSRNAGNFSDAYFCNGVFDLKITTQADYNRAGGRCFIRSRIDHFKLKDDIKYSRLTNRYYAWYGYVNKYYPQELQFDALWNDLGKLGFVPGSYFRNGLNAASLNLLFQETYPAVLATNSATQNQDIIAVLQQLNVLYESLPYADDSYYNYLADEYCEFIPMTKGQVYFVTGNQTTRPELITKVQVYSDYAVTASIPWPASEEYIVGEENKAKQLIEALAAKQEIDLVNYADLPLIFDKQSIDLGGLGQSRLLVPAALGKKGRYQKNLTELAAGLPKAVDRHSLEFTLLKAPEDVRISFDDGAPRVRYSPERSVVAQYSTELTGNVFNWSTEQDFFLKNGVIDSPPLIFNEYGYAPDSGSLPIYEAYFATVNRRPDLPVQNVTPIDYYTFLERDYYNPASGRILNPNLDFERWTVQVYDRTGRPNPDLSVEEVQLSNTDILQNTFKARLNLDAAEKRYVEISGAAAGPYELLYSDGDSWQTIATGNPAEGRLGWWDVTRLNGSYTVALKVYAADGAYSLAKQDVFIGELLRSGDASEDNKRVSSPYKRAEVYFHPQSYSEDKFITVAPIKLQDLRLHSQPELYTLGPIAEILPHGSEFPEPDKRPTVVFRYSRADLAELRRRGMDVDRMALYYITESGALEQANSEVFDTEYGREIWTVLRHFSPYTILAGEVPEQPSFQVVLSDLARRRIKIFGQAEPRSALEIYLDDDAYFGDQDGESFLDTVTVTTDASAWVFDRRAWAEGYAEKLTVEQQARLAAARNLLQEMYLAALADNQAAEREFARQYALLMTADQERAQIIRDFLLANNQAGLVTVNSGVELQDTVDLALGLTAPALHNCLPERLEIILRESFPVLSGAPARIFQTTADALGYFVYDLPLDTPTCSIYVTYALTGNIQNRPVARLDFVDDPEAPRFLTVNVSSAYLNEQNLAAGVTVDLALSEAAKLLISCYDSAGELVDLQYQNTFLTAQHLTLRPVQEGHYYYTVQAVDPAGNAGQAYGFTLTVDLTPPQRAEISLPQQLNPRLNQLQELLTVQETIATYSIDIADWAVVSGAYVEQAYPYVLTAADAAGNTATFSGTIVVDITPPVLTELNFGPQAASGVRVFWPEGESGQCAYLLSVSQPGAAEASTYNTVVNYYYDQQVSRDRFYAYTLQAVDPAGNTSNILRRLVYTADDTLQVYVTADVAALNYKDFQARAAGAPLDSLFVVQRLEQAAENLPSGLVQLTAAYRLLNSAGDNFAPLEITLAFEPGVLADKYIRLDSLTVLRRAGGWTADGLEILTVNYQEHTLTFRTAAGGDYALFGGQEYWLYDRGAASLRFVDLRDNDYVDIAVTISAEVRDPDTAVDTRNMWLLLDNTRYVLPPESLLAAPASGGRAGRLSFNLQKMLSGGLTDGGHVLDLYVLDQAGHTANATLRFTTDRTFQIDRILPAPNPFTADGVYFTYQLSRPADSIEIRIYDVNGRLVRALTDCGNQPGYNKTRWDGRDRHGMFVANDVYLYVVRVEADGRRKTFKGKIAALR
ncbi:MAG: hypothetical protein LBQ83_07565 [Candidatus Margulisbacteria bacterium]|nr:hypothetical protein [Candidatus Margulisiibacteriota bacterium]